MKSWKVAVGSINSWSPWVISITLLLRLITALTTDPNRTQNFSPLWLLIWAISVIALSAWVLLVMALGLYKRLKTKPRPFANLITIGIAGIIGNLTVGLLALNWGLDTEPLWAVRISGGFLGAVLMFFIVNTLRSNLIARNESIRKLVQTEQELLGYRESAKQIIADEIESLKEKTVESLLPAIEKVQELLATKSDERTTIAEELRQLIRNDVRPLSKSVLEEAATIAKPGKDEIKRPATRLRRNVNYNFKLSMRPMISLPLFAAFFPMAQFLIIDHRSAFRGLLGGIATGLTLALLKALTPRNFEVKVASGITMQLIYSVISIVPTWWIMFQEYGNTSQVITATTLLWFITFAMTFLLAFTKGVELNAERYELSLTQYTAELAKEVALFEQKLALEKRAWSRVIHGEVQSALSAAVTRLQRAEHLEPYELEMVKQDLNRAKQNLINPPKEDTNFTQAFSEIVLTWKSICNIQADISARAQRAVDTNQDTRIVTNEIIKEAVSNAVRHGQAKNVSIKLDRIKDDILEIEIQNDGFKPARDKTPGLGSQLLDELTLSWSLETKNNKTTLKAEVPISKN
jgi:signal transduction histidine kinase